MHALFYNLKIVPIPRTLLDVNHGKSLREYDRIHAGGPLKGNYFTFIYHVSKNVSFLLTYYHCQSGDRSHAQ